MKARRLCQIASALLAVIFAITFVATGIIAIFSFVNDKSVLGNNKFGNFFLTLGKGFNEASKKMSFLPQEKNWGFVLFTVFITIVPALFLVLGALILFSKPPKSGKQGFHNFGCVLAILGTLIFVVLAEVFAKQIFPDKIRTMWMIICGAASALLLFLLFVALFAKVKKAEVQEEANETAVQESPASETAEQQPTSEVASQTDVVRPTESAAQSHEVVYETVYVTRAPQVEPKSEPVSTTVTEEPKTTPYIPDDTTTVQDIVINTYGNSTENLTPSNMEKIQTLRSLLDAGAISKDEYIKLVNSYLGLEKK